MFFQRNLSFSDISQIEKAPSISYFGIFTSTLAIFSINSLIQRESFYAVYLQIISSKANYIALSLRNWLLRTTKSFHTHHRCCHSHKSKTIRDDQT